MWRIIYASLNVDEAERVMDYYRDSRELVIVSTVNSYDYLLSEISEYRPDAVFIDSDADGYMESVGKISGIPIVILLSENKSYADIAPACEPGYVLRRPFAPDAVRRSVWVMLGEFKANSHQLRVNVSRSLGSMGIQPHLEGYRALRDGIVTYIMRNGNIPMGEIYSQLATRYGKNVHCIERSMRNAIENAWMKGDIDYLNSIFGYTIREDSGKPANREFIAMVADKFIMER